MSVLAVLLGLTSGLLDDILFGAAVFPMAKFSTVVTVVSGVWKSILVFGVRRGHDETGFLYMGVLEFQSSTGETEQQMKTLRKVSLEMQAFSFCLPCSPPGAFFLSRQGHSLIRQACIIVLSSNLQLTYQLILSTCCVFAFR